METRVRSLEISKLFDNKECSVSEKFNLLELKVRCFNKVQDVKACSTFGNKSVRCIWFFKLLEIRVCVVRTFELLETRVSVLRFFQFSETRMRHLRKFQHLDTRVCAGLNFFKFWKQEGPRFKIYQLLETRVRSLRKLQPLKTRVCPVRYLRNFQLLETTVTCFRNFQLLVTKVNKIFGLLGNFNFYKQRCAHWEFFLLFKLRAYAVWEFVSFLKKSVLFRKTSIFGNLRALGWVF